jgi:hypothetical protein
MPAYHLAAFSTCAAMRPAVRLTVLALLPLLAGCAIHPIPENVSRKTTYDIVDKIRCEAKAAVMEFGRGFKEASLVYNFTFDIVEVNNANAGFTLLEPLTKGGPFNLTASGSANRTRGAFRNFQVLDSFDDLRKMNCSRDREKNWIYPLAGDVGMYDSVATFIRLQQADDPTGLDATGKPRMFTFTDTLAYTTTLSGDVTATVALAPLTDQLRLTAANAMLTGSRTDVHTLVVTMAAGDQTVFEPSGRVSVRRSVPFVDAPMARSGFGRNGDRRFARGAPGGAGDGGLGVAGGFNNLLSTRMLQQESGAENRALYEQDRQRQLELQRRSTDIRVLVGP